MSDGLPIVQAPSVAGVAAMVPYITGYQPSDGFVVLLPFAGSRFAPPIATIPLEDLAAGGSPITVEERARNVDAALAILRESHPKATAVIALTWGKFADHENFMATTVHNDHGFVITHGHVQDGMYTEIYPLPREPEPMPIPPIAHSVTVRRPLPSYAAYLAQWDRTPMDVPPQTIVDAKSEANALLNTSTMSKILAAARLHLKNIVSFTTPNDVKEATIVRVAALIAASERVRDNLAGEAMRDGNMRKALTQTAKLAPNEIAGEVVALTTLATYSNLGMSGGQAAYFLRQAPPTEFGVLVDGAINQAVTPEEVHAVVNHLQQFAANAMRTAHPDMTPDRGPAGP